MKNASAPSPGPQRVAWRVPEVDTSRCKSSTGKSWSAHCARLLMEHHYGLGATAESPHPEGCGWRRTVMPPGGGESGRGSGSNQGSFGCCWSCNTSSCSGNCCAPGSSSTCCTQRPPKVGELRLHHRLRGQGVRTKGTGVMPCCGLARVGAASQRKAGKVLGTLN